MKKIILTIVFVFLGIIFLNAVYHESVIKNTLVHRKAHQYQEYQDIMYLFEGDSHMQAAIDPRQFSDSIFNIGAGSKSIIESYYELRNITRKHTKYIVINVDMHSFSSYMLESQRSIINNMWYYKGFMDTKELMTASQRSFLKVLALSNMPFIGKGSDFIAPKNSEVMYGGYLDVKKNFTGDMHTVAKRRVERQFLEQERISPLILDHFKRIGEFAARENKMLIILQLPVSRQYHDELESQGIMRDFYYARIFSILEETGADYIVIDYYDLYFENTYYFIDSDHLNYMGARNFSALLNDELKSRFGK